MTHTAITLVPRPVDLVPGNGSYLFSEKTVFAVENKEQEEVAGELIGLFTRCCRIYPQLNVGSKEGDIRFITDTSLKNEAYILNVSSKEILIKAANCKGFFYALQTIRQLLPPTIESIKMTGEKTDWEIPAVTITDEPRFGYRGLMLDVARFFMPKENVLQIIDCMALLKINKLHFHLTDDNGWRD